MKYYIHDNGWCPFLVIDDKKNKKIQIYSAKVTNDEVNYEKNVYNTKYTNIYIGDDPSNITKNKKLSVKGNSILVHINKNKYLWIGMEILEVNIPEKILKFYSPVGNNDVPYPYAIGKENTFLFLEKIKIDNKVLSKNEDPYDAYYRETHIKNELAGTSCDKSKVKNGKCIKLKKQEIDDLNVELNEVSKIKKSAKKIKTKIIIKRL